ncbi:MAG: hypothetical protein WD490_02495 [Opitutales bacterium]
MKRTHEQPAVSERSRHWRDPLPKNAKNTLDTKQEHRVDLTIDANLGLRHHPIFRALRKEGWEIVDFDITEDRGREIVVQVILVRW